MSTRLNAGLIGCSEAGAPDRAELRKDAGYRVRAVFDPARSNAEKAAGEFGPDEASVCDSFEALIARSELDVVIIASPAQLQAGQTCAALAAGKHVICESPGALTVEDGDRIVQAQRESGRAVAFHSSRLRCAGYTSLAREYLSAGRVGRIYRVELVYHRIPDAKTPDAGSDLENMGMPLLDQALDLLNWPQLQTLCAHSVPQQQIVFSRVTGDIAMTMDVAVGLRRRHSITILGDKGGLVIDHSEGGRGFSFVDEAPGLRAKLIESKPLFSLEAWGTIYKSFREHLAEGRPHPGATAEQARELAVWRQMVLESAELRREVGALTGTAAGVARQAQ